VGPACRSLGAGKKEVKMKKILFIIIVNYSLLITNCFTQWQVVSTSGNEAVNFPSNDTGYSTANGITKKTINGGLNWTTLSGGNLTGIYFINNLTGWVVGYPGYIGKTTTGGSFVQQTTGVSDRLNDVYFINDNTGWVVGGDFGTERIFKTTNGGTNWIPQTSGTANKLFAVYFIDANTGWSVGGPSAPKIIKTTNGGDNWFLQTTTVSTPLYSVMFADANTGWAVAGYLGGETIIKTTNGGANWFSQSSGDTRYLRECFVINSSKAFAVGQGGKLIMTTNGGNNWIVQTTGSSVELWSIDFVNDTVGYAIGDNVVLKTTNGGVVFVNNNNSQIPEDFKLYQNYPNPFNPSTTIRFSIPVVGNGRDRSMNVIVYDNLGREITTLVNEKLKSGEYNMEWDASDYPSGVYYYRLTAGSKTETKKMVLLK
jgi:photosystem II stability/assembly factor-like uncharacterized protein